MNDAVVVTVTLVVPTAAATRKKKLLVIMIRESEFMGRMGEIVGTGRGRIEGRRQRMCMIFSSPLKRLGVTCVS